MKGILLALGATIGGWAGWWLGLKVGITTAILLSAVGTGAGIFLTRRLCEDHLE
nr:hypothetical protein [uncultured Holophaga sp.]